MPDDEPKLSAAQRRAYIRSQIPIATWFNKSGAEILRELKARGYGINTADFYSIQRDKIAPSNAEQVFRGLGPNDTIPVAVAEKRPDWNLSNKYLFQFKVVGRDPKTGDKKIGFFALSKGDTLGKDQAIDAVSSMIEGQEEFYGIIPEEIDLYQLYSKG